MQWPDVSDISPGAWAAILTPVIGVLLFMSAGGPVKPDAAGWIKLKPTIGIWTLGILVFFMGLFFLAVLIAAIAFSFGKPIDWLFFILCPPLVALGFFGLWSCTLLRVRFNDDCIEYRGLFRTIVAKWSEVLEVRDSVLAGPHLITPNGRMLLSKYFRGYKQLLAELRRRQIPGAENPSLDRSP